MDKPIRNMITNDAYRDGWDAIFGKKTKQIIYVDEIVGTSVSIGGMLFPKRVGTTYIVRSTQREFCTYCGAGIGKHKRYGEGTCHECGHVRIAK